MSATTRTKTARKVTTSPSPRSGSDTSPKPKVKKPGLIGNQHAKGKATGRPPKLQPDDETLKKLENLGKIQCTTKEAAAVLDVSEPTFIEFIKRYEKARDVFEKGKENGKASLRRMQLKAAENGNVTMLIWLGKQLLGQKDQFRTESEEKVEITVTHVRDQLSRKLDRIAASGAERSLAEQPVAGRA